MRSVYDTDTDVQVWCRSGAIRLRGDIPDALRTATWRSPYERLWTHRPPRSPCAVAPRCATSPGGRPQCQQVPVPRRFDLSRGDGRRRPVRLAAWVSAAPLRGALRPGKSCPEGCSMVRGRGAVRAARASSSAAWGSCPDPDTGNVSIEAEAMPSRAPASSVGERRVWQRDRATVRRGCMSNRHRVRAQHSETSDAALAACSPDGVPPATLVAKAPSRPSSRHTGAPPRAPTQPSRADKPSHGRDPERPTSSTASARRRRAAPKMRSTSYAWSACLRGSRDLPVNGIDGSGPTRVVPQPAARYGERSGYGRRG